MQVTNASSEGDGGGVRVGVCVRKCSVHFVRGASNAKSARLRDCVHGLKDVKSAPPLRKSHHTHIFGSSHATEPLYFIAKESKRTSHGLVARVSIIKELLLLGDMPRRAPLYTALNRRKLKCQMTDHSIFPGGNPAHTNKQIRIPTPSSCSDDRRRTHSSSIDSR
jgi:hypothetical protein